MIASSIAEPAFWNQFGRVHEFFKKGVVLASAVWHKTEFNTGAQGNSELWQKSPLFNLVESYMFSWILVHAFEFLVKYGFSSKISLHDVESHWWRQIVDTVFAWNILGQRSPSSQPLARLVHFSIYFTFTVCQWCQIWNEHDNVHTMC